MMGLYHEARRLLSVRSPTTTFELEAAAQVAAAGGCYRDAAKLWQMASIGKAPELRAHREERIASCWWRRGQLLKACVHLRRELRVAEKSGVTGELRWQLAATTAHVFGHMRRRPLLQFFPTQRRRLDLSRHLPTVPDRPGRYGPHLDALLAATRSRLTKAQEHSEQASLMFNEAEALHGVLNFRHASLRRRGCLSDPDARPTPEEYLDQQRDFWTLGLTSDAARVPLVPGASRVFRPSAVWRGLGRPDFAVWHRLMLLGGYLISYTRQR